MEFFEYNISDLAEMNAPLCRHAKRKIPYLPIEFLKETSRNFGPRIDAVKIFGSSGTTQQGRSQAEFSEKGLSLYRSAALYTFGSFCERQLGPDWRHEYRGISLIRPSGSAPESSLSQMLSWFAEIMDLSFISPAEFSKTITDTNKPVIIFGTAFDLITLADEASYQLPTGSLIFETGGTKGLSRELSRAEFYALICARFDVSQNDIISEYSMCELASQAYDWNASAPLEARRYSFPAWVRCFVMNEREEISESGIGCLTIYDPLRVDLPLLLRTQDLVDLAADGSFQLFGRLSSAPLKGCSIAAEQLSAHLSASEAANDNRRSLFPDLNAASERALELLPKLREFLQSDSTVAALTRESGSRADAKFLLDACVAGIPVAQPEWHLALATALGNTANLPERWLFIAPKSHSFAMIYPLVFAALLRLRATIRLSARSSESRLLVSVVAEFLRRELNFDVSLMSEPQRINSPQDVTAHDAIFCFGETQTVTQIRQDAGLPCQGFGSSLSFGLLSRKDALATANLLARDAFAMAQRGCMSVRGLFLLDHATPDELQELAQRLAHEFKLYWQQGLSQTHMFAIQHERVRYQYLRHASLIETDEPVPLFPTMPLPQVDAADLGRASFILPIFNPPNGQSLPPRAVADLILSKFPATKLLICNAAGLDIPCRQPGDAQMPAWDGLHEKRPLFLSEPPL